MRREPQTSVPGNVEFDADVAELGVAALLRLISTLISSLYMFFLSYATSLRPQPQTSTAARVMLRRRGTQRRAPRTFFLSATCTLSL